MHVERALRLRAPGSACFIGQIFDIPRGMKSLPHCRNAEVSTFVQLVQSKL
jgi:hypothetical protein